MNAPKVVITATQAQWACLLSKVNHAADPSAAIPILAGVKFHEHNGYLHATCTDLTITLSAVSDITVPPGLAFAVNQQKLMGLFKLYASDTTLKMTLEFDKDRLLLQSGKSRSTLGLLPPQDFPEIARPDTDFPFSCEVLPLWWTTALRYTEPFMAQKDSRLYLNGLRFQAAASTQTLLLTASDGRRLAQFKDNALPSPFTQDWDTILPRTALTEVSRLLLQKDTAPLTLRLSASQLKVTHSGVVLYANLIESKYPDVSKIIPPIPAPSVATVSTLDLQSSLKHFAVLHDAKATAAVFDFKDGILSLRAHCTTISSAPNTDASDELEVDYRGPDQTCAYNVGFLQDALKTIQADTIELHNFDASKPLRIVDPADPRITQLIMPLRVST